ncbi:MAG: 30S ribosome-binding factor RbfA [Candidatus Pacebacteria bacterium]|nr:30S ribosome-binding factor RbfA [Candidatus Paceibacterota bacterium]
MTQRILKVNKLIKQEIGKIISSEINFPMDIMVTVMKVEVSKDLRYADVFISILPFEKGEEIQGLLKENMYDIQKTLNKKLFMKPLPRIRFCIDESGEYVDKISDLIKKNENNCYL